MMPPNQPCWVLGAGFLGSRLRARLPYALSIDSTAPADVQGDAAEADVAACARRTAEPQFIFCCLSTRGGDAAAYRRTYAEPLRHMPPSAKIIFCSTLSAGQSRTPQAAVLREAEACVLKRGGVVVRLAALYGEGRCELLRRHLAGEPRLAGAESRVLRYIHVEDAAEALLCAAAAPSGIYAACGEALTKAAAYRLLEEVTGIPAAEESTAPGRRGTADTAPDAPPPPHWIPMYRLADFCRRYA